MKQECWDIIVTGAGASGCMAAITAARRGARVLLLEKTDQIAKKIPATGNGKCNFTNAKMTPEMFRGSRELVDAVLPQFRLEDTLSFFHEIGILPYCKNGYYYPNSKTASSVRNALEAELQFQGVESLTGIQITEVKKQETFFEIKTDKGTFFANALILATGLLAAPKLGSDGSAFPLVCSLGHHFTPLAPALCGFYAKGINFRKTAGVRTDVKLTLYIDDEEIVSDLGELQLTDYGVSGIPVFQISRFASFALQKGQCVELSIDFLPYLTKEQTRAEIVGRFCTDRPSVITQFRQNKTSAVWQTGSNRSVLQHGENSPQRDVLTQMNGLLHEKLLPVLLSLAGINAQDSFSSIPEHKQLKFCNLVKACRVTLTAPRDYEYAQICAGGVRTEDIVPDTLESRLVPGLFFAGELLDVDGLCGGYNLQWAWSSGYVAGVSAAERSTSCMKSSVIPGKQQNNSSDYERGIGT